MRIAVERGVAVAAQKKDNGTVRSSPTASYRILTYGYDAVLLDTRRLLLNQAGYEVEVAASPQGFEAALNDDGSAYKLLVLCHTVPSSERDAISKSRIGSKIPVYQVSELILPTEFLGRVSALLS